MYLPLEWAIIYYLVLSAVGVSLMLWDRHLAKNHTRKWVNELLMLFVALLGGAPAMMVTMFVTGHKLRKPKFCISLPVMTLVHAAVMTGVVMFGPTYNFCIDLQAWLVLLYVLVVSVVSMVLTFIDKRLAQRDMYRLKEDTLMLWAGLGGATAMLVAMLCLRHKTRHVKFMLGLPIMIVIQGALFYWLWMYCPFVMFHH